MRIAVTGSVATDHLMTFPGRMTDQLLADHLDHVSLSFLADTLEIRNGGPATNIAYGLARLKHRPLLVGAVGTDFRPHGEQLSKLGVDVSGLQESTSRPTARILRTVDAHGNQLMSFYPGAETEAAAIDLVDVVRRHGGIDLVLIGADEPAAMLRHSRACRSLGIRFLAAPSHRLDRLDGAGVRELVEDADHLFTSEPERELLIAKAGWTPAQVLCKVGTWVTTLGEEGCRIDRADKPSAEVPAIPLTTVADSSGFADAFRAGYLAALARNIDPVRCAETGEALAALAVSKVGAQSYEIPREIPTVLAEAMGLEQSA
ncbi:PfkB family carbohydrate kinase [Streptomyces rochei]|uniref:PfkB family carbohydrate kinase n=1 Tax=Streptomyces rochei TaxID=1928 RepID=UPI0036251B27